MFEEHKSRKVQQFERIILAFYDKKDSISLILYKGEAKFWTKYGMTFKDEETRIYDINTGLNIYKLYFTKDFNPPDNL